jgi:diacylglycerol kinase
MSAAPPPHTHHPGRAAREVGRSFVYAFEGLLYTVYTQRNMRFHLFVAVLALATAVAFRVDDFEKMVLMVVICLVPSFEIINTSIEAHASFTGERHELIKRAKDTAAAAVLVMSLCSMAVGGYILLPRLIGFFKAPPPPPGVLFTHVGFRLVLMLSVWGCLLFFWVLRSYRHAFFPALSLASVGTATSLTWLCINGHDPASWVALLFISSLLLNAFARAEFEARIAKQWLRVDLPFEIQGFKLIIPGMMLGMILGALTGWWWLRDFPTPAAGVLP